MADLAGRTLGPYEIVEEIGRGGMAVVYKALQPSMERTVAIKVMPREFMHDPTFLERFQREVRAIARLAHPRILPIHDVGEVEGVPYFAMRYAEYGSLADRIKQGPLGLDETVRLMAQIAEGLDYAHRKGVIHRDFKPSNVLLDEEGNVYLGDFGIAKVSELTAQLTGSAIIGTPAYMAPEMAEPGGLSSLADIYALGVTLFQMLTGSLPYEADTPMGVLMAHVTKPIPDARELRPDLPDAVQAVVERAMAKDPAERYQTAGDLVADLRHAVAVPSVSPTPIEEPEPMPPAVHERPPTTLEPTVRAEEPTPPSEPTPAAPPAIEVPPLPKVTPAKPARRGVQPAWIVGGVVGLVLCGLLVVGLALGGVFAPPPAPPTPSEEEPTPEEEGEAPPAEDFRIGLVTDVGEIDDKSFNQSAWEGAQQGAEEVGGTADYIETQDARDYGDNIAEFAEQGYDVIVTVGFAMGEATLEVAEKYPNVYFIGVDQYQYQGEPVDNVAGLIFQEDQSGFLAGALAGYMTESGVVAGVYGTDLVPPVVAFKEGYEAGAKFVYPDIEVISTYHPGGLDVAFTDPEWGATVAAQAIDQGADVVFGAGGKTGNGALIETAGYGVYCIGVDTDQWETVPEAHPCLISSAIKLIVPGVADLVTMAYNDEFPAGNYYGNAGLAPFHDFEDVIPDNVKAALEEIDAGLRDGSIETGYGG